MYNPFLYVLCLLFCLNQSLIGIQTQNRPLLITWHKDKIPSPLMSCRLLHPARGELIWEDEDADLKIEFVFPMWPHDASFIRHRLIHFGIHWRRSKPFLERWVMRIKTPWQKEYVGHEEEGSLVFKDLHCLFGPLRKRPQTADMLLNIIEQVAAQHKTRKMYTSHKTHTKETGTVGALLERAGFQRIFSAQDIETEKWKHHYQKMFADQDHAIAGEVLIPQDISVCWQPEDAFNAEKNAHQQTPRPLIPLEYPHAGCIVRNIRTGEILGGCTGYVIPDTTISCGKIFSLWLEESIRTRGIGKKLLQQMGQFFRSQGCLIVIGETIFPDALALYLQSGARILYEALPGAHTDSSGSPIRHVFLWAPLTSDPEAIRQLEDHIATRVY